MLSRIMELHDKIKHCWSPFFSENEQFLTLALAGEVAELGDEVLQCATATSMRLGISVGRAANLIKKRWRDPNPDEHVERVREEIADVRVYLELLAHQFGISGSALDDEVEKKLRKVAARYGVDL